MTVVRIGERNSRKIESLLRTLAEKHGERPFEGILVCVKFDGSNESMYALGDYLEMPLQGISAASRASYKLNQLQDRIEDGPEH
ncbi:MAG: hypothetical protein H0X13_19815 [Ramlibacter sp.]|nr:hypothetical protein [Ramlibacter sp.]